MIDMNDDLTNKIPKRLTRTSNIEQVKRASTSNFWLDELSIGECT